MTANRKYKLLLLSSSDKLNTSLLSLLSDSSFEIVKVSAQAEAARRFLAATSVDIVIINTPLADESGLRLAAELCTDGSRGVLVFVRAEDEKAALSAKIEELRLINRAKCVLIDQLRMSEADAHHYIEKQAMDRCISRRAMAEKILSAYR